MHLIRSSMQQLQHEQDNAGLCRICALTQNKRKRGEELCIISLQVMLTALISDANDPSNWQEHE